MTSAHLASPAYAGPAVLDRRRTTRLAAAGACLIAACYGLARFAFGLFVPALRSTFDLSGSAIGAIASAAYASYCVAIVVAALLTPRLGARAVATGAGVIATAGTALIAAAPNAVLLVVGVVLAGSSTGVASPPLAHAVAGSVAALRQPRIQAIVNGGTGLGVAVAGPVALVAQGHWRSAWAVFAVLCAGATWWVASSIPRAGSGHEAASPVRVLPDRILPPGAARLIPCALLLGVASCATWTFGRDLLTRAGGMGANTSTVIWIVLGASGMAGATAGDLVGHIGVGRAWSSAMLLLAGATALLAIRPGDVGCAAAAAAVFGAAYIALTGVLLLWGARVYADQPSAGVGLAFLVLAIGQSAGALALGAVSDQRFAFAIAALVAASAALMGPRRGRVVLN